MKTDFNQGTFEAYGVINGAQYANVLYVDEASGYAAVTVSSEGGAYDIAVISLTHAEAPVTRI